MKSFLALVIVLSMLYPVHAQTIMGFNVTEIASSISEGLKGVGLVPDLQSFDRPETKAYFIVFFLLWMVFSIAIGLPDIPSGILSFFAASFLFNRVPSLFVPVTAMGLFEYVFSALFIFVWVDYIMHYMWAISRTTKLFIDAAVTMMAVMFMNSTNIFAIMSGWVEGMISGVGFIIFMIFLMAMKVFNTYFSFMNLASARGLRRAGARAVMEKEKEVEKTVASQQVGREEE